MIVMCQLHHQQSFTSATPAVYASVRYQVATEERKPVVASSMPFAILSDPSLATRASSQGSLFARPSDHVKQAPQNDIEALAAFSRDDSDVALSSRRAARHIRIHRIADVNVMDQAINGIKNSKRSSRYLAVDVEPQRH